MAQRMQAPVLVLDPNTTRESGRKAQLNNIEAGITVSDVIRTCLGPRAMLKMRAFLCITPISPLPPRAAQRVCPWAA